MQYRLVQDKPPGDVTPTALVPAPWTSPLIVRTLLVANANTICGNLTQAVQKLIEYTPPYSSPHHQYKLDE
jgi:hypothetical protein